MKNRRRYLAALAVAIILLTSMVEAVTIDVSPRTEHSGCHK